MGYGNKSVSGVHPILKHMNKLGGNPEIKYDPIAHDEKGMGRGGKLGTAKYKSEGMPEYKSGAQRKAVHASKAEQGSPAYGKMKSDGMPKHGKNHSDGMPKHGYHDKGMPMHKGYPHQRATHKGKGRGGQNIYVDSSGNVAEGTKKR